MVLSDKFELKTVITLDVQRRHVTTCGSRKQPTKDCPSASKKKCPYRLFGVGIDQDGNRRKIRKSLGYVSHSEAIIERDKFFADVKALNVVVAPEDLTVKQVLTKFFLSMHDRKLSHSQIKHFHAFLDHREDPAKHGAYSKSLIAFANEKSIVYLSQMNSEHIEEWRRGWTLGKRAAKARWGHVKQFFRIALRKKWIKENPTVSVDNYADKKKDNDPVVAFSEVQLDSIFDACGDNKYAETFMNTLLYSGVAIADGVQLGPAKLEGQHLSTYRTKTGAQVKVKLPEWLVADLNALPVFNGGLWFWNRKCSPETWVGLTAHDKEKQIQTAAGNMRKILAPIYRKSGVILYDKDRNPKPLIDRKTLKPKLDASGKVIYMAAHSHQLRHTFVKTHLKAGTSVEEIANMIGDTVAMVCETYAHFIEERQEQLDARQEATFASYRRRK